MTFDEQAAARTPAQGHPDRGPLGDLLVGETKPPAGGQRAAGRGQVALVLDDHAGQLGDRFGAHDLEHPSTSIFDGPQAHFKPRRHRAVLAAVHQEVQNLSILRREPLEPGLQRLVVSGPTNLRGTAGGPLLDEAPELVVAERLVEDGDGPVSQKPHGQRGMGVRREHDDRHRRLDIGDPLQELEPVGPRHAKIRHHAGRPALVEGVEPRQELRRRIERLNFVAERPHKLGNCSAGLRVVVDDDRQPFLVT